jgi:hypothetical protein
MTGDELFLYANNYHNSGHLKAWKANSIVRTLEMISEIVEEKDRLEKYISGCLKMEGFSDQDCKSISNFVHENMQKKASG